MFLTRTTARQGDTHLIYRCCLSPSSSPSSSPRSVIVFSPLYLLSRIYHEWETRSSRVNNSLLRRREAINIWLCLHDNLISTTNSSNFKFECSEFFLSSSSPQILTMVSSIYTRSSISGHTVLMKRPLHFFTRISRISSSVTQILSLTGIRETLLTKDTGKGRVSLLITSNDWHRCINSRCISSFLHNFIFSSLSITLKNLSLSL